MSNFFSHAIFIILRPYYILVHLCQFANRKLKFREYHWTDSIVSLKMIKPQYVSLGRYVRIGANARIEGISKWNNTKFQPMISIGEYSAIQQDVHITCAKRIEIGKYTAIAARVTITDIDVKEVIIGDECKIYNGAVILPGVHIGKHCVVGANSVVNINVPDYSVAVGMPAKIIKRYDFDKQEWRKTDKNGLFID